MQATLELSPDLIIRTFCNAWEEVARTMAILRTRIVQHNDVGLFQVVLDEEIRWIEATGLDEYLQTDRTTADGDGSAAHSLCSYQR